MSKLQKSVLAIAVLSVVSLLYAQQPPPVDNNGIPYLAVNVNPTPVPPMVNINPYDIVPRVEVTRMPNIKVEAQALGCDNPQHFRTGISESIAGPLMLTYVNIPERGTVTLASNGNGSSQSINLASAGQIATAIYLQFGQRLDFSAPVLYSGCVP